MKNVTTILLDTPFSSIRGSAFWTGANRPADSGFQWSDGEPFEFNNWAGSEPDEDTSKSCGHIGYEDGMWFNNYCASHLNWICKLPTGKTCVVHFVLYKH